MGKIDVHGGRHAVLTGGQKVVHAIGTAEVKCALCIAGRTGGGEGGPLQSVADIECLESFCLFVKAAQVESAAPYSSVSVDLDGFHVFTLSTFPDAEMFGFVSVFAVRTVKESHFVESASHRSHPVDTLCALADGPCEVVAEAAGRIV